MRLSDAMMLGRTLDIPFDARSFETCAIGIGMASFGVRHGLRSSEALKRFPWLETIDPKNSDENPSWRTYRWTISKWYFAVARWEMTFDELIDKVRAIEPPETETTELPAVLNLTEKEILA